MQNLKSRSRFDLVASVLACAYAIQVHVVGNPPPALESDIASFVERPLPVRMGMADGQLDWFKRSLGWYSLRSEFVRESDYLLYLTQTETAEIAKLYNPFTALEYDLCCQALFPWGSITTKGSYGEVLVDLTSLFGRSVLRRAHGGDIEALKAIRVRSAALKCFTVRDYRRN